MKNLTQITAFLAAIMLSAGAMADPVELADGGTDLQSVLDGITTDPVGDSSVDVNTDQHEGDEYWQIGGSGGSVTTVVIELSGYAGGNTFGIYDMADPENMVMLFDGSDSAGSQTLLSILADGSVVVAFSDTAVDFADNAFGFYLDTRDETYYSDPTLNPNEADHMVTYEGGLGDDIQLGEFDSGPWGANEYILAWEDLLDEVLDYTDFVVLVESVSPVPAPGTLVLLGMALAGLGMSRRRKA